jgi:hypothetical protein
MESTEGWRVRIDFPGHGYINLVRECGATSPGASAVLFIDCICCVFAHKLDELHTSQLELAVYASAD